MESQNMTGMDVLNKVNALRAFSSDSCGVKVYETVGGTKDFDMTLTNLKDDFVDKNGDDLKISIIEDVAKTLGISPSSISDVTLKTGGDGSVKVTVTVDTLTEDDWDAIKDKGDGA